MTAQSAILSTGSVFRAWKLHELLGDGSSAQVFRAVNDRGETCALKLFKPWVSEDPDARQEALRRLDRQLLLRQHDCPFLITILEAGEDLETKTLYVAMEYVRGQNLEESRGRVPIDRVRPLISQIATAVQYLAARGVFHRDIRPANIIISPDYRNAVLADLGVVVPFPFLHERTVAPPAAFRSVSRYSPPEFDLVQTPRSPESVDAINFYQLGAVLYELITRRRLFEDVDDQSEGNLMAAIKSNVPPLGKEALVSPTLADLAAVARRALSKSPRLRLALTYESFIFKTEPIKPTIYFLYAGGTITAAPDAGQAQAVRVVRRNDKLLSTFTARIRRDYRFFHPDNTEMPFNVEWDVMPDEHQILSENASPAYWNALADKLTAMLTDVSDKYVLGVIVLHGTDTMAYSSAALTFALTHLPCPVVLTGSNQPPLEESSWELDPVVGRSDVWRNLLGAIRFLETFGHRHPEVWLSFADTITLGVNVRKTVEPALSGPNSTADVNAVLSEPFTFRRPEPHARYDFRAIDGTYVNNFYPAPRAKDYRELISMTSSASRHRRGIRPGNTIQRAPLKGEVIVWSVSPAEPLHLPTISPQGRHVLLIDGYSSGTFPSIQTHPAVAILEEVVARGIPVVLITADGLLPTVERYDIRPLGNGKLHTVRMFGVVKETAVPLVHRILGEISDQEWDANRNAEARCALIHDRLEAYLRTQESVANLLLGSVTDPALLRADLGDRLQFRFDTGAQMLDQLLASAGAAQHSQDEWQDSVEVVRRSVRHKRRQRFRSVAIVPRPLLLFMLGQSLRLHDLAGAGPDAMECAYELGYEVGRSLMRNEEHFRPRESASLFFDLPESHRRRLLVAARHFVRRAVGLVRASGFSEIRVDRIELPMASVPKNLGAIGKPPGFIGFRFRVRKQGVLTRTDELYSVHVASEADRKFFSRLSQGIPYTQTAKEFHQDVEEHLSRLFTATWGRKLSVVDWTLVGLGRAMSVAVASYLNIDPWVDSCTARGGKHLVALRAAVGIEIAAASDVELVVTYTYLPRLHVTRDGELSTSVATDSLAADTLM